MIIIYNILGHEAKYDRSNDIRVIGNKLFISKPLNIDLRLHSIKDLDITHNVVLVDDGISYLVRLRKGSSPTNYIIDFMSKPTIVCCDMYSDGTCNWFISETGLDKLTEN